MLTGIDISNWQRGYAVSAPAHPGFVIAKATEGTSYVDKSCDSFVQQAISAGIPFGFYHFANGGDGAAQARYFRAQTKGYEGRGIPVLDFEKTYTNQWIDDFVREYHAITGVFPWVYMSADYVNNRGYGSAYVRQNCGLWLAGYPKRYSAYPSDLSCPYAHAGWTLAAWQFTDCLKSGGMEVDGDVFYGDTSAWSLYATGGKGSSAAPSQAALEGDKWHLARQVLNGVFGDGDARKATLGPRYDEVQACVNALVNESDSRLATRVVAGQLGDGDERKYVLGGRYGAVQRKVNQMV